MIISTNYLINRVFGCKHKQDGPLNWTEKNGSEKIKPAYLSFVARGPFSRWFKVCYTRVVRFLTPKLKAHFLAKQNERRTGSVCFLGRKKSLVISQGSNTLFIKGCSVLTLSLPCLSVQIQHESFKSMNSVQQQCDHHH